MGSGVHGLPPEALDSWVKRSGPSGNDLPHPLRDRENVLRHPVGGDERAGPLPAAVHD